MIYGIKKRHYATSLCNLRQSFKPFSQRLLLSLQGTLGQKILNTSLTGSMAYEEICQGRDLQVEYTITKSGLGHGPKTFPKLYSKLE